MSLISVGDKFRVLGPFEDLEIIVNSVEFIDGEVASFTGIPPSIAPLKITVVKTLGGFKTEGSGKDVQLLYS